MRTLKQIKLETIWCSIKHVNTIRISTVKNNDGDVEDSMKSMAAGLSKKTSPLVFLCMLLGFYNSFHKVGYFEESSCRDAEIFNQLFQLAYFLLHQLGRERVCRRYEGRKGQ